MIKTFSFVPSANKIKTKKIRVYTRNHAKQPQMRAVHTLCRYACVHCNQQQQICVQYERASTMSHTMLLYTCTVPVLYTCTTYESRRGLWWVKLRSLAMAQSYGWRRREARNVANKERVDLARGDLAGATDGDHPSRATAHLHQDWLTCGTARWATVDQPNHRPCTHTRTHRRTCPTHTLNTASDSHLADLHQYTARWATVDQPNHRPCTHTRTHRRTRPTHTLNTDLLVYLHHCRPGQSPLQWHAHLEQVNARRDDMPPTDHGGPTSVNG